MNVTVTLLQVCNMRPCNNPTGLLSDKPIQWSVTQANLLNQQQPDALIFTQDSIRGGESFDAVPPQP